MKLDRENIFERWVAVDRKKLLRLAHHLLQDHHEAEDVVQETLLSVWRAFAGGNVENLHAYGERAVWVNAIRRRSRRKKDLPMEPETFYAKGEKEPSTPSGEDLALSSLELEEAIRSLPPGQQSVIRLRYYSNMSFREIGIALQISMNTAASRCRYALAGLKRAVGMAKEHSSYRGKGRNGDG